MLGLILTLICYIILVMDMCFVILISSSWVAVWKVVGGTFRRLRGIFFVVYFVCLII